MTGWFVAPFGLTGQPGWRRWPGRCAHAAVLVMAGMLCWVLGGCASDDSGRLEAPTGPLMRPGENCLSCHRANGPAPPWSAAGTVYRRLDAASSEGVAGVKVRITDARGKGLELVTNEVGNFYTAESLDGPFRVEVEADGIVRRMPIEAPAGSCNACHSYPDPLRAKGRIFAGHD